LPGSLRPDARGAYLHLWASCAQPIRFEFQVFGHAYPGFPNRGAAGTLRELTIPRGQLAQLLRCSMLTSVKAVHSLTFNSPEEIDRIR